MKTKQRNPEVSILQAQGKHWRPSRFLQAALVDWHARLHAFVMS